MYTNEKNVQIVLQLLKAHNIKNFVISPGTTNLPLVRAIQTDVYFEKYSVVDERSAAYFAIGLSLEKNEPVALTCTAAQATRNYIPGLTEAFYKKVPILAITVSKHPKYTYQEYMQAPDQTTLPNDAVKKTFALPIVESVDDFDMCNRMANDAMLELSRDGSGPVQLNMPIVNAGSFGTKVLPEVRVIKRYYENIGLEKELAGKKIQLVIGEHKKYTKKQISSIDRFCDNYNVFVYANHLANYHGKYALNTNLSLTSTFSDDYIKQGLIPDILITIGDQPGDYPLHNKMSNKNAKYECWRINENGDIVDAYDHLTRVYQMPFEKFFNNLPESSSSHEYYKLIKSWNDKVTLPAEIPFSNAYLASQLHDKIPANSRLNFGILNSLRVWSFFDLPESVYCNSNVSAFGIDGDLSLLIGQSMATDELCFCVLGDLAFFYDMNSLGIRSIKNNLRVLLVNNGCGAEFRMYNHAANQFGDDASLFSAAAGHNGSGAQGWAEANNFKYLTATNKEEFTEQYPKFLQKKSNQPILFEVFTTPADESEALKKIVTANFSVSSFKGKIVNKLTPDQKAKLKAVLKLLTSH